MRTRISKHGKYEIMEGVEREVGDMLQSDDLLTIITSTSGEKNTFEVRERVRDHAQFAAIKHLLRPLTAAISLFSVFVDGDRDFFTNRNVYLLLADDGCYRLWKPSKNNHPVKIKRRIKQDTGIVADTVIAGDIHADRINGAKKVEEAEPQVPTEPGLYRDNQGDYVLFHRHVDSPALLYTYFTLGGEVCVWHETVEAEYSGMLLCAAPFVRVTAIKDVEVER